MKKTAKEKETAIIHRLVRWAEEREAIRALIWTSTRANPNAPIDLFSDYDIILAVRDIRPFHADDSWLEDFGKVLVVYRDPIGYDYGIERFARITQYEDGTKIDYSVCPVELVRRMVAAPKLPGDLDVGYAVLLDKDHLTDGLQPPTYTAFIPAPPSETEYLALIEDFLSETPYVAKNLWRDELIFTKYCLDQAMKHEKLCRMLEWRVEIDHNWSLKTGVHGKGLKKHIRPELWSELENTYVGAGIEENWEALFRTMALFRKVAVEVGDCLGYAYPYEMDQRVVDYLQMVKRLDRQAEDFIPALSVGIVNDDE